MTKITDYTIAWTVYAARLDSGAEYDRLQGRVRKLIAEGWQPFGSISMQVSGNELVVAQPMVRYD